MQSSLLSLWWLRIVTFLIAALAAASATYWALQWNAGATPAPHGGAAAPATPARQIDPQRVARLLGGGLSTAAAAPVASAASRFTLTGVIAGRSKNGYAIIAIDGQPPRPYRVGSQVGDALLLQSVQARSAALAPALDGPVTFTLELPSAGTATATGGTPARQPSARRIASTTER